MGTGVAMILYSCDTESDWSNAPPAGVEWPATLEPYIIQLLDSEIPELFPVCDTHFCDYKTVRNIYDKYISRCDRDELCTISVH